MHTVAETQMILDQAYGTHFFFFKYKKSRSSRFSFLVDELKDRGVISIMRVPFSRKAKESKETNTWLIL